MKNVKRLFTLAVLVSGTLFVSTTMACSLTAWDGVDGDATVGEPSGTNARVSGKCGLKVSSSGYVTDNSPTAETTFLARFYFYPKKTEGGPVYQIFRAYSDESGTEAFRIEFNGTDIILDAAAAGGDSASAALIPGKWNQVEFAWTSGGQGLLWINRDAASASENDTFNSGTGSIDQIRLGAVGGIGGDELYFDDYESHRSLPIGTLIHGDANGDGVIKLADAIGVLKEARAFGSEIQPGIPDCNLDGKVSLADAIGILKAARAFGAVPCS